MDVSPLSHRLSYQFYFLGGQDLKLHVSAWAVASKPGLILMLLDC